MKTIEQMAEESGINTGVMLYGDWKALEHFAALVAERCAQKANWAAESEEPGGCGWALRGLADTILAEFPKP